MARGFVDALIGRHKAAGPVNAFLQCVFLDIGLAPSAYGQRNETLTREREAEALVGAIERARCSRPISRSPARRPP